MIQGAFRHRPGRVIALGRLVLAAVFMLVVWLGPQQANPEPRLLLAAYDIWAAILLLLTWRNWSLDQRLAEFAHMVDIAIFGLMVYFTEGYTSPFYTFFVFLMLSAAIRWSWRETALTAIAVLLLFVTAGAASLSFDYGEVDRDRLLVRLSHLVVLSLIIIWFRINEQPEGGARRGTEPEPLEGPPIEAALRRAAERMKARRMVFVWWQPEEPWVNVTELDGDQVRAERLGPDEFETFFSDPVDGLPFLFDDRKALGLTRSVGDSSRQRRFRQRIAPDFARRFKISEGIVIRVRALDFEGEIFALDINGLCAEDLRAAEALGEEISSLLDRWSMAAMSEEAAVTRARMSLARDLHDGAVQGLAGAAFRLEGLKSWLAEGKDAAGEIDAIKAELAEEQRSIRAFIAGLRGGRGSDRRIDLGSGLPIVADQLHRRWGVRCDLAEPREPVEGPLWMEHELHQILHEAVANAVRHGEATALKVSLGRGDGAIALAVEDNGIGVAAAKARRGAAAGPASLWSVRERVNALGGSLDVASDAEGTRLEISLPVGGAA
jgi:signal transduction histidine kinase